MHSPVSEAPEVVEAMTKAAEYEALASSAKTKEDRDHYEKMQRKWLGVADGWRFIAGVAERHS
jgi:hypothetical protein